MNGFLVLARCSIDDIPLKLFHNKSAAQAFARDVTTNQVFEIARRVFVCDTSVVVCIDVLEFVDGIPTNAELIAEFQEVDRT